MFYNEFVFFGDHISGITASCEVPLGFLDAPGYSLQKIHQNWKSAKNCGKSRFLVGLPSGFPLKLKLDAAITRVLVDLEAPK